MRLVTVEVRPIDIKCGIHRTIFGCGSQRGLVLPFVLVGRDQQPLRCFRTCVYSGIVHHRPVILSPTHQSTVFAERIDILTVIRISVRHGKHGSHPSVRIHIKALLRIGLHLVSLPVGLQCTQNSTFPDGNMGAIVISSYKETSPSFIIEVKFTSLGR